LYFLSFWVTSKLVRPPLPGSKGMFVRPWRKLRIRHRAWAVWQGMLGISWECPYGVNLHRCGRPMVSVAKESTNGGVSISTLVCRRVFHEDSTCSNFKEL
jgi:hypothetical protein